ncbi:MAG: glycosyl hydrolase 53 family protein, partial [Bacteroidales bacterium]|nr:glycosyl hydrolase 53 family protein [Bacteroidales bacterium]
RQAHCNVSRHFDWLNTSRLPSIYLAADRQAPFGRLRASQGIAMQRFCYWGAELVACKGPQAMDGSCWENQALFDFANEALPALDAFASDES